VTVDARRAHVLGTTQQLEARLASLADKAVKVCWRARQDWNGAHVSTCTCMHPMWGACKACTSRFTHTRARLLLLVLAPQAEGRLESKQAYVKQLEWQVCAVCMWWCTWVAPHSVCSTQRLHECLPCACISVRCVHCPPAGCSSICQVATTQLSVSPCVCIRARWWTHPTCWPGQRRHARRRCTRSPPRRSSTPQVRCVVCGCVGVFACLLLVRVHTRDVSAARLQARRWVVAAGGHQHAGGRCAQQRQSVVMA
jgi:hypothetical protein